MAADVLAMNNFSTNIPVLKAQRAKFLPCTQVRWSMQGPILSTWLNLNPSMDK